MLDILFTAEIKENYDAGPCVRSWFFYLTFECIEACFSKSLNYPQSQQIHFSDKKKTKQKQKEKNKQTSRKTDVINTQIPEIPATCKTRSADPHAASF